MSDNKEPRLKVLAELTQESQKLGLYETPMQLGVESDPHDHTIDFNTISVLDKGFVRLVDSMGNDASIAQAARVSYGKGTKSVSEDETLIRYLLRHKHTTPFEMVQFKFHIKAPIFVFRQWHRHRMWSYNEYSGRYSEMKDEFYKPETDKITTQNPNNKQGGTDTLIVNPDITSEIFDAEQKSARDHYEDHLKTGMRKELARINLPLAQYSEMYASVDLHNLLHFLKLRQDSHAQYEIRVYADAMFQLIKTIVPIAIGAYGDYILNSITLTKKDVEALREALRAVDKNLFFDSSVPTSANEIFSNKREKEEFLSKVKLLMPKPI